MLIIRNADGSESSLEVRSFHYKGSLSQPYTVIIDVLDLNHQLAEISPLLRPATLSYSNSLGKKVQISGIITSVPQSIDPMQQKTMYQLRLEPYLSLLAFERALRVHNQQSILEICQDLIQGLIQRYGLTNYVDFQVSHTWFTAPMAGHNVQYEKHSLRYFQKLLSFGQFYFKQTPSGEQVVVIDQPFLLPTGEQTLVFDPASKEDLHNDAAALYVLNLKRKAQNLQANPFYFDPFNPEAALAKLTSQTPLIYETSVTAPTNWVDFIKDKITSQLAHDAKTYDFNSYYSALEVGERLNIVSITGKVLNLFIESLEIKGYFQDEVWRFDVSGRMRPFDPQGDWLGPYQPRARLPGTITGARLQDTGQVNDSGSYQVKFPIGFDIGGNRPDISVREIQETVTQGGGASHAVSGTANAVLLSQDGLPSDLLLMGSLIDNARSSHVGLANYRDTGVKMKGGLKLHMTRQDESYRYGELGTQLQDSQSNPAHLTLGANTETLSNQGDTAHGIRQGSTGYAKQVVSGNHYQTVGQVDQPVMQSSLVGTDVAAAADLNPGGLNAGMKISDTGLNTLKIMEAVVPYYYEDSSGYCSYGVGHLVATRPCARPGESNHNNMPIYHAPVSDELVNTSLRADVATSEDIVIKSVTKIKLSQAKFDALVCFTYNNGKRELLDHVNQGDNNEKIVNYLLQYDLAYNKKTKKLEKNEGLLKRSEWEAVAFGYKGPYYKNYLPPSPTWGEA